MALQRGPRYVMPATKQRVIPGQIGGADSYVGAGHGTQGKSGSAEVTIQECQRLADGAADAHDLPVFHSRRDPAGVRPN